MDRRMMLGWLLVLAGGLFLLETTGWADLMLVDSLLDWRSIALAMAVLFTFANPADRGNWAFLYFSALVNIPRFTDISFTEALKFSFPVLMILYGLMILAGRGRGRNKSGAVRQSVDIASLKREHSLTRQLIEVTGSPRDLELRFLLADVTLDLRGLELDGSGRMLVRCHSLLSSLQIIVNAECPVSSEDLQIFGASKQGGLPSQESESEARCSIHFLTYNFFSKVDILSE